ncbi:MAG: PDZ domain-containing protein [Gemmatimonadetes bacterium]|nr:PDZ domain-containing protein [Gemmatimonadota bacterium]
MTDGPAPRSIARRLRALVLLAVAVGCATGGPPDGDGRVPTAPTVDYFVRMAGAGADRFQVSLAVDRVRADSIDFVLPAWIPGQYGFGPDRTIVESFAARDGEGRPVATRRLGVASWRLYTRDVGYLALSYDVIPDPPVVPLPFRTQLELHYGYSPGAGLLGTLRGFEERPVTIAFDVPRGWKAITPLRPSGPNRYAADSYGAVPGMPIVIGDRVKDYKLFLQGKAHQVTVHGVDDSFAPDSLLALVGEAVDLGTRFFGAPPPYERYVFAIHFVSPETPGWGGMGAADGATIFLPRLEPARLREAGLGRVLLHQYLHAWFPARFGPAALVRPRTFTVPPPLEDFWFVEGTAEYYAHLLPARFGREGREAFYDAMGRLLTNWRQLGGVDRIDPDALVQRARVSGDETEKTRMLIGGTLATFLIDIAIREETRGLRGLDQAMDYLQRWTPEHGYDPAVVWIEVAGALGVPVSTLGPLVEERSLSIEAGLARAGLRTVVREESQRSLGARLVPAPEGRFVVTRVEPRGTAASAGIAEGDRLLKINETPISPAEGVATTFAISTYIREARLGESVRFEVERDGEVRELRGVVRESRFPVVRLVEDSRASSSATIVRSSLFDPGYATPGD